MRCGDDHSEGSVLCRKTSIGHIYRNYTEYKHLLMKCFVAAVRRCRVDPHSQIRFCTFVNGRHMQQMWTSAGMMQCDTKPRNHLSGIV